MGPSPGAGRLRNAGDHQPHRDRRRDPRAVRDYIAHIARLAVKDIGYEEAGFHWEKAAVEVHLHAQSSDIAQGVDTADNNDEGAGAAVPRARLNGSGGKTTEWKSHVLRNYQRRTRAADALIAGAYLSGTNTRRVRRHFAAYLVERLARTRWAECGTR
jgi:hypothetical protein